MSIVGKVALVSALLITPELVAQPIRTFVSVWGTDNSVCDRANPCRTFSSAISAVAEAGEVVALDSGGYSGFTINKSVAVIVPDDVHAAVAPTAGTAITVNPPASAEVVLRGIFLRSLGATTGVGFSGGGFLTLEDVVVQGFVTGIAAERLLDNDLARLSIRDTVVRNGTDGLRISSTGANGRIDASIASSYFDGHSGNAIAAGAGARVNLVDSTAAGNDDGFTLFSSTTPAHMNLERCTVVFNARGVIVAGSQSQMRISRCVITQNEEGLVALPGLVCETFFNNTIAGNDNDINGIIDQVEPD